MMYYHFSNPYNYEEINTTSILQTNRDTTIEAVYYDLFGRRVDNPQSGLYIKDAKKVFVK